MVAVATVPDEGAAQALAELLDEHGIPVEVRSFGINPYLGAATPQTFEVRVPEERLDEARAHIQGIDGTPALSDADAADAATDAPGEEPPADKDRDRDRDTNKDKDRDKDRDRDRDPGDELPAERSPRLWMVVPLGIVAVVPIGCLYARWPRLGYLLLSVGIGGIAVSLLTGQFRGLALFAVVKAVDMVLAPTLLGLTNRRRGEGQAAVRRGLVVSALCLLAVLAVALFGRSVQRRYELSKQSTRLFEQALKQIRAGQPPTDEAGQPLRFPEVPLGQVQASLVEYCATWPQRLRRAVDAYVQQRQQWASPDGAPPSAGWIRSRQQDGQRLCTLVTEYQSAWEAMVERLQPAFREEPAVLEFFNQFESAFLAGSGQQRANHLAELLGQQCKLWQEQAQHLADDNPDGQSEQGAELTAKIEDALNGL